MRSCFNHQLALALRTAEELLRCLFYAKAAANILLILLRQATAFSGRAAYATVAIPCSGRTCGEKGDEKKQAGRYEVERFSPHSSFTAQSIP